ncbi:MAG: AAA-like domain protein [Promethearchaeota archaeon]|nr:MAG: AAA-like domain protein [Candidatus Lokiarchaeota archaeon]
MITPYLLILLNLFLFFMNLFFYILKIKDLTFYFIKYPISILFLCCFLGFSYSINVFSSFNHSEYDMESVVLLTLSIFLFSLSIILFLISITHQNSDVVDLPVPSKIKSLRGSIKIGKTLKRNREKHNFYLSLKDLEKHMFICGFTGTGKTNFLQNFLIQFTKLFDLPFLLVEFKGEYQFLQEKIEDLLVIKPGENFSINIFNPEGADPEIHAERIFDILKSGQFLEENAEYSPQMQKVLVEILTLVCKDPKNQTWKGFFEKCDNYLNTHRQDIPMLPQTLISIKNRIRRFSLGPLKALFIQNHLINVKELFERNVLIDLSSIIRLGGEKEDALFFLNMILKYLWDKNLTHGAYNFRGIKHLTIIEDIQYFAPKDLTKQTKLTSYLEDIALLQRGTGECLISVATRPHVSEEILANCGVLIIFKNHMSKELIRKLLNLEEEQEDYLALLEEGQCITRINSIKRPFLLHIPLIPRHSLNDKEIQDKNQVILNNILATKKHFKMTCSVCSSNIYEDIPNCPFCGSKL